jgi:hypothetical protein
MYLWLLAALLYGLCIGFVSIQFIKGSIVSFCLTIIYGFCILGTYLYTQERKDWKLFGKRVVIQYYIISYIVALIITIGWVAKNGLVSRNEGAR